MVRIAMLLTGALVTAATGACGGGGGGDAPDAAVATCDPSVEPCIIEHSVSIVEVVAGAEDEDLCQSWTLDNPTELWVTGIRQTNDGAYHHANWFHVPDDTYVVPDGGWVCSDEGFDELTAAILGGFLFAMSTQSRDETQSIPAGGAIRIPPYSRIIGASHVLNAGDVDVVTETRVELHTVPPEQVAAKLTPARIEYRDLHIEPEGRSAFTAECMVADDYEDTMAAPFEYVLYYALTHYHALGVYAQLEIVGGPRDGEILFRHDGFGENTGIGFDPPVDLAAAGARGLRYTCGFDNPRADEVRWGIGDQEMCVVALQAVTDMAFDADVSAGAGARIGETEDGEARYAGPCSILGIPWDHDKPGGPPR